MTKSMTAVTFNHESTTDRFGEISSLKSLAIDQIMIRIMALNRLGMDTNSVFRGTNQLTQEVRIMVVQVLPESSVVSVQPDTSVKKVIDVMEDQKIGSVVIVEGDRPVGIVTDRDLVLKVLQTDRDPLATAVGEVMTEDLVTQEQGLGFFTALRKMSENGIRRMPIVDEEEKLVDIVTLDDMVRLLAEELDEVAHIAELESTRDVRKYF